MPKLLNPALLATVYDAARKKIAAREIPTTVIGTNSFVYRSINPNSPYTLLPEPVPPVKHVSKVTANKLLIGPDEAMELGNRFSGPSRNGHIPGAGALYCVQQQQALMNESMHYSGKNGAWALGGRCVLKIRILGSMMVAELSPHNPAAMRFLKSLGKDIWDKMNDPADCSVARGIGLAIANSGYLRGISVQTVRESERSEDERGDNLVLYGAGTNQISGTTVDEAWYYSNKSQTPTGYVASFP